MRPWREGVDVVLFVDSLVERDYGFTQDWLCEVLLHWYLVGALSTRRGSAACLWKEGAKHDGLYNYIYI